MSVEQDKRGLRVLRVFDGSPAAARAASEAATSSWRSTAARSPGVNSEVADQPHQGPGRHRASSSSVFTPGRGSDRAP